MASGIRCAETTSAAYGTSNSSSAVAAADITGQSESEPITRPTRAVEGGSDIGVSHQVRRGVPGPAPDVIQVVAHRRHVADLATRPDLLAVELHPQPTVPGEAVQQRRRQILDGAAEHVAHHGPLRPQAGIAEWQVEHAAQMVL